MTRVELSATAIWTHPSPNDLAVEVLELIRRTSTQLPDDVVREVYPFEDFELARSTIETSVPEDSLFAGLE